MNTIFSLVCCAIQEVPDLWAQMADNVLVDGIDILPIVVQDDPLPMWLPGETIWPQ